ncbi:MAG: Smr/MutS family protein [Proteobacteria bacterium]|nr:Smr/MutS family protein [Pseudomonadota bacterium]
MAQDDSELDSFRKLVGKVRRLEHDTVAPDHPRPPPLPRHSERDATAVIRDLDRGDFDWDAADSSEVTEFHRPGLQRSVLRKLRRGRYAVQAELDLHGLTVPEAKERLAAFLERARGQRFACVRIIHGKGLSSPGKNPVLKPKVGRWLRQHGGVLAFTSAPRNDGGSGALYVLLRRKQI